MSFQLDHRVKSVDGHFGSIRYIGKVCTAKDPDKTWFGVEWDGVHGKHNGSVVDKDTGESTVYFECEDGKGSFVTSNKLQGASTLCDALKERYDCEQMFNDGEYTVDTTMGKGKVIELVGADKTRRQQKLSSIEKVDLSDHLVKDLGDKNALMQLAPLITQLNLQANLWHSWMQIMEIVDTLSDLEEVVLSKNRLCDIHRKYGVADNMRVVVLNDMKLNWNDVGEISCIFPQLQECYLKSNELQMYGLSGFEHGLMFQNLRRLDVSHNGLKWATIEQVFGHLPKLQTLTADDNCISDMQQSDSNIFPMLKVLSLSNNSVATWKSLEMLNKISSLSVLRFSNNPLAESIGKNQLRLNVIGRLKYINLLNGSEVHPRERADSERMYLKGIFKNIANMNADEKANALQEHPRFEELQVLYNSEAQGYQNVDATGENDVIADSVVQVKVTSMAMDSMTMQPISKKLPIKMTVWQLKKLLQSTFKLDSEKQLLSFRHNKKSFPLPMDNDDTDLGYVGIQNDSEIIMNEKC